MENANALTEQWLPGGGTGSEGRGSGRGVVNGREETRGGGYLGRLDGGVVSQVCVSVRHHVVHFTHT